MNRPYKWTKRLSVIGIMLFLASIILGGGGHGYFEPFIIGFPWMSVSIIWTENIPVIFILAGVLQYPIYGLIIDKKRASVRIEYLIITLIISHILLMLTIFAMRGNNWK
jgi:hypothetical protein